MNKTTAIILAGGQGSRFGSDKPKQFALLAGEPLLVWAIRPFQEIDEVEDIVVVAPEQWCDYVRERIVSGGGFSGGLSKVSQVIAGDDTRAGSTRKALDILRGDQQLVAIHDGARPTVAASDIRRVITKAAETRAAILASPLVESIKLLSENKLSAVSREGYYKAETPQVFELKLIRQAHEQALARGSEPTDDAQAVEEFGADVSLVESEFTNIKVTGMEDIPLAEAILSSRRKGANR